MTGVLTSVVAAFLMYTIFSRISIYFIYLLNVFSLVVIHYAIKKGESQGAIIGALCGLIQDSFSLGIFGVAGISKTIMGFAAGYISRRIDIIEVKKNFIFIFLLMCTELIIWSSLYLFLLSERVNTAGGILLFQPFITALVGSLFFSLLPKLKKRFVHHENA